MDEAQPGDGRAAWEDVGIRRRHLSESSTTGGSSATLQTLEFQRDEASLRALRRLARYLEPDQRSRIGPSAGSRTGVEGRRSRPIRQLVPLPMKYLRFQQENVMTSRHTRARCGNQFRACDRLR